MARLIAVLLAVLLGVAFWYLVTGDPRKIARTIRYTAVGLLAILGLFLAGRGLAILDIPLGAVAFVLLQGWAMRGFSGFQRLKDRVTGWGRGADMATIETPWLRMQLDRASGGLDGEVLAGSMRGAWLHQLDLDQLKTVLAETGADVQSTRLLETYLDRAHAGWRDPGPGDPPKSEPPPDRSGRMTREEALEVLGLSAGATREAITEAHHSLMAKLHPDHGGSNYLASRINAARDVLLR